MDLNFDSKVVVVGAGAMSRADIDEVLATATNVIAADGGATHVLAAGRVPDAVIGDFDTFTPDLERRLPIDRLIRVSEQETTDFEKCLSRISAPLVLGIGFTGQRLDHELAVYNALVRYPSQPCVVLGGEDLAFHAPQTLRLDLPPGSRLSLFPMASVRGKSKGLKWPIDGIEFRPDGRVGTSNLVTGPVELAFEGNGMLVITPRSALHQVQRALLTG